MVYIWPPWRRPNAPDDRCFVVSLIIISHKIFSVRVFANHRGALCSNMYDVMLFIGLVMLVWCYSAHKYNCPRSIFGEIFVRSDRLHQGSIVTSSTKKGKTAKTPKMHEREKTSL